MEAGEPPKKGQSRGGSAKSSRSKKVAENSNDGVPIIDTEPGSIPQALLMGASAAIDAIEHRAHEKMQQFYAIIYLVFFFAAIVWPVSSKSTFGYLNDGVGASSLFRMFAESSEAKNQGFYFLVICILSNTRFLLGGLFATRDSSFKQAIKVHDSSRVEKNMLRVFLVVKFLMIISTARTYTLFSYDQQMLGRIILTIEICTIWIFDYAFRNILLKEDANADSNRWIIGIDIIYGICILTICWIQPIVSAIYNINYNGTLIRLMAGGCASLIILEFCICYMESVRRAWGDARDAVISIF